MLKGKELIIILPRPGFDPENFNNPVSFAGSIDYGATLDPSNTIFQTYTIKSINLYDD
jgi:hypothetical protein